MISVIVGIVVVLLMVAGCLFVNDTKKKHGVCCGKGCAGCPVFEEHRQKSQEEPPPPTNTQDL